MTTVARPMPQRTCLGCRQVRQKGELIRLVATPEGGVKVDLTRRHAGRGAYLCPDPGCWQKALKIKVLEKALHTQLAADSLALLRDFARALEGEG